MLERYPNSADRYLAGIKDDLPTIRCAEGLMKISNHTQHTCDVPSVIESPHHFHALHLTGLPHTENLTGNEKKFNNS
jgi:hypothetical protein